MIKFGKMLMVILMVGALIGPAVALAAEPAQEWIQLDPGEQHWYTLDYRGTHEFEAADEEDEEEKVIYVASQVEIRLDANPDGGARFMVVTPDQVRMWQAGEKLEACGCGTENEYATGDLSWSGNFGVPGTYYVIVDYTGSGTGPVYYTLDISGEDVSVKAPGLEAESGEPAGEVAPEAMAVAVAAAGGSGPGDALAPNGEWTTLSTGQNLWYAFDYTGHHEYEEDEDDEVKAIWIDSPIYVWLDAEPDNSAHFRVLTEEQVRLWAAGEEYEPVGQGTENEYAPGDISWSGSFAQPGKYYILVEQQGPEAGQFLLMVSGEDVW